MRGESGAPFSRQLDCKRFDVSHFEELCRAHLKVLPGTREGVAGWGQAWRMKRK